MKLSRMLIFANALAACDTSLKLGNYSPGVSDPGVYDAGAGTCSATCSTPAGLVASFASDAELQAGIIGIWQFCNGAHGIIPGSPSDTIGVEFAPETTSDAGLTLSRMYFLTRGPSGPVRGPGFDYQLTYVIDDGILYCRSANGGNGFSIKYSPCPREWQIEGPAGRGIIVPF